MRSIRSHVARRTLFSAGALALAFALAAPQSSAQDRPATPSATPAAQAPTPAAGPQRFELRPTGQSRVLFTSDAPLETVDGISTQITGGVTVDPEAPSRGLSGRFEVSATSLRTGVDLRDEHLRGETWLDAARFPTIGLQLTGTTLSGPLAPNAPSRGDVRGRFTLHGVTRDVTVHATVRRVPLGPEHAGLASIGINADMLRIQGEFEIALTDFNISVPSILRIKVSNTIRVRVDLTAFRTDGRPAG